MTTILSTPTRMTLSTPGSSMLDSLAASMSAGTWAQLAVPNQDAILSDNGSSGSVAHFCNSMPWNPMAGCIEIVAADHHDVTVPWIRHMRYVVATNQFVDVQAAPVVSGIGHGYDHNSVNPVTGDLYHRQYSGFTGSISVFCKTLGASSFVKIPTLNDSDQVAIGTCWWTGSFAGGGAQGSLAIFSTGNCAGNATDGQIAMFNPLTNTWFFNKSGMSPNYGTGPTYHSVMQYSASKNVAVYGGGNAAPNKVWRLNSDGSFNVLTNVPSGKAMGVGGGLLVEEPITGNFLLLSAGQLWELNPNGAGTWTQQSGSRTPPGGVGNPTNDIGIFCAALPQHGVVAYITQDSRSGGTFFLYKHA